MRKILIIWTVLIMVSIPVRGLELTAPTVPSFAEDFMPSEPENLTEGIRQVIMDALAKLRPDMLEACHICLGMVGAVMIVSLFRGIPSTTDRNADLAGAVGVSVLFLSAAGALIDLGTDSVYQISNYGKLLIPVMSTAMAAQGGITGSAALYSVTALFDAILAGLISRLLIPMLYLFLMLSVSHSAVGEDLLKRMRDGIKWLMTWVLKTVLYIFTGFISITGVISGPTDAAALKAAKLTISGFVPIVGGILSEASEAVLVSAGAVKNAMGLYGLFAVIAVWIGPFLRIGAHYLLLRFTGSVCGIFGSKRITDLIQDFATAMGFLLAMTGSVCLMLLISTVCFMRGLS